MKSKKIYVAQKGFTLTEILIAVVIIALLSTVGITSYVASFKNARDARRKADLESLRSALELFHSDNSTYPETLAILESPKKYISLPKDPKNDLDYYYLPEECAGSPSICNSYTLATALENVPTVIECEGVAPLSCKNTTGQDTNCTYCLDPYGKK